MASSALSVCSSDLSYSSRVCLPGSCDSCTGSSWQVDSLISCAISAYSTA